MKKNILVSVDPGPDPGRRARGEGEARPRPSAGRRQPPATSSRSPRTVERRGRRSIVGNIYKGKVDNVLPGMEAAFVDIGLERNGFLHVDEIVLPGGQVAPSGAAAATRRSTS